MRIVQGGYDFLQYHAQNKPTVGITGAVFGIAGKMRRLPAYFDNPVSMRPILFVLYIPRLHQVIANHLPSAHGYADDIQLYLSFRLNGRSSQDHAIACLEACISDVGAWLIYNRLFNQRFEN